LIELQDKRKFFTHKKNFSQLIEFCNSFKANMSLVNMKNGNILDLDELAPAFCNPKQKKQICEYTLIENKIITKDKNNKTSNKNIKNYIKRKLLSKNSVDIQQLKKKYNRNGIDIKTINNCFYQVKNELKKEGYNLTKISTGNYKIS
jgi:hypothetical protein